MEKRDDGDDNRFVSKRAVDDDRPVVNCTPRRREERVRRLRARARVQLAAVWSWTNSRDPVVVVARKTNSIFAPVPLFGATLLDLDTAARNAALTSVFRGYYVRRRRPDTRGKCAVRRKVTPIGAPRELGDDVSVFRVISATDKETANNRKTITAGDDDDLVRKNEKKKGDEFLADGGGGYFRSGKPVRIRLL